MTNPYTNITIKSPSNYIHGIFSLLTPAQIYNIKNRTNLD